MNTTTTVYLPHRKPRAWRKIALCVAVVPAVLLIVSAAVSHPAPAHKAVAAHVAAQRPAPAASPHPHASKAVASHPLARMTAVHAVRHLVPHLGRSYIMRRVFFRRGSWFR